MRVAVVGAGGVGGFFGGLLAKAGEDVTFVARGAHLEALRTRGLTVRSRRAGEFTVPVRATDRTESVGPVDLVLVCVKTYDTVSVLPQLPPLVGPDTAVLSLQNGVDNAEWIARVMGGGHVLGAVAYVSSVLQAPGVVEQVAGAGRIVFGEFQGEASERARRLLDVFRRAGIDAELSPDVRREIWQKFLFICGFSGVTALTRLPIGTILACPETRQFFCGVLEEVREVARAGGVGLADDCVERAVATAEGFEPWARGSLYADLVAGRRLELEALNGTVVRLGRERGVPTPLNFAVYAALKPYAGGPVVPDPAGSG
jgi:2-dehydropantoate 2-reductase